MYILAESNTIINICFENGLLKLTYNRQIQKEPSILNITAVKLINHFEDLTGGNSHKHLILSAGGRKSMEMTILFKNWKRREETGIQNKDIYVWAKQKEPFISTCGLQRSRRRKRWKINEENIFLHFLSSMWIIT